MASRLEHKTIHGIEYRQCSGPLHNREFVRLEKFRRIKNGTKWDYYCTDCRSHKNAEERLKTVGQATNRSPALVVRTADLAAVLKNWIKGQTFPPVPKKSQKDFSGDPAVVYIAERVETNERQIRVILQNESQHTSEEMCDKILALIGRPDLSQSTLKPFKNPRWTDARFEAWQKFHDLTNEDESASIAS